MASLSFADSAGWSAEQATGAPNTEGAGDQQSAWATLMENKGDEWLKLGFPSAVKIAAIRIHENFNPGAVSKVTAFKSDGTEAILWEGEEPREGAPNIFEVEVTRSIRSQSLKIYLDTKRVNGWNEIDAVQLVAKDGSTQWASTAAASSSYASKSAISMENLPASVIKTVPQSGDTNVDPSLKEVRVTFSKDMITKRSWSFSQISNDSFPKIPEGQKIHYIDNRTCVLPVELEPGKTYVTWLNSGKFKGFRDTDNHPSVPYLLVFTTRSK
jgi:RNA polymerase sigma-70 factor (ECF subfamily)